MMTTKSVIVAASAIILFFTAIAAGNAIPSTNVAVVAITSAKSNPIEVFNGNLDGIRERRSDPDTPKLYFCSGLDFNDHDCFGQNLQLTHANSACWAMPKGYLKSGQSMYLTGFRCRIFTNSDCDEKGDNTSPWFTNYARMSKGKNIAWKSYMCRLGDP